MKYRHTTKIMTKETETILREAIEDTQKYRLAKMEKGEEVARGPTCKVCRCFECFHCPMWGLKCGDIASRHIKRR